MNEIFSIKYDYIKYPPIIFRGKLGNIRPVNGEKWTRKAQELFFESVSDCLVWADIKEVQVVTLSVKTIFELMYI